MYFAKIRTFDELCTFLEKQYGKTTHDYLTTLIQTPKK